ncbi:MAG: 3-dehydroquinate synthase [Acidobacteria bacterium]|nr:3-dehydroquinate synthase [Acidobacteriota bacterium]
MPVELGARRYAVSIGHGVCGLLPEILSSFRGRRIVVVSNSRVWSLHGPRVEKPLRALGPLSRALVPDGERHKSRETLNALHDAFLDARLSRDGLVVAFGGGVVGDLAGFAAATYMRGLDWIVVPTTLLAMVDSAVGGKVGINHPRAKNLIGAFHQPGAVVADPALLATLPPRELRSGVYEVLKCGVLGDRALFKALQRAPQGLAGWERIDTENAIASACRIKAEVVEKDEREGGLRRVLNLGHTLGHALEAVTRYRRFTHGEAVGWGLVGAGWISRRRGLLSESAFDAVAGAVDHLGPRPRVSDLSPERILKAVGHDKKARGGRLTFVLPTGVGRVVVRDDVQPAEIERALEVMAAREALLG